MFSKPKRIDKKPSMMKYGEVSRLIVFLLLLASCGSFSKFSKIGVPKSDDYKLFASRKIEPGPNTFHFYKPDHDLKLGETIEVDSRKMDATDEPLDKFLKEYKTLSFMIIRNDTILHEYYDQSKTDTSIFSSFSVAKAFISGLVGIAIAEGKISGTETKITDYFPELQNQDFDSVTIDHLLNHTSGIHYKENKNHIGGAQEFYWGNNLSQDIFNIRPYYVPGERFEYSNINAQLLALILKRATGLTVSQYLEQKIWKPLEMEYPASWSLSGNEPDGTEKAFCCLNARTVDFAKFGRLYLNRGNWNGKQIIPESWIDQTVRSSKANGQRLTYHYNWGIGPKKYGSFYAIGLYGQLIYIYPEKNVIILRFGKADLNYNPPFLYHTLLQICDQL